MYIRIDSSLPGLANDLVRGIREYRPDEMVILEEPGSPAVPYYPGEGASVVHLSEAPNHSSKDYHTRLGLLNHATLGMRDWFVDFEDALSPTFAGHPESVEKIIKDAAYAEQRAVYFHSFGVGYAGRTYVSPRSVLLVDSMEDYVTVLKNLPAGDKLSPWSNLGFVTVPNLRALRKFVDDHFDTNFLAYSTKDKNRLKKLGVDFGEVSKPEDTHQYGVTVRSTAALMRPFEVSN